LKALKAEMCGIENIITESYTFEVNINENGEIAINK